MKGKRVIALFIMAALFMCACKKDESTVASSAASSVAEPEKSYPVEADDKSGLYTAFLNNEEQVTIELEHEYSDYDGSVDDDFKFEPGENLSLNTLTERVSEAFSDHGEDVFLGDHRYIDCGNDGEKELLVTFQHKETDPDFYSFVIKEREGKLYLRFGKFGEGSDIGDDGYVQSAGKYSGSSSYFEEGFLDKDCNYIFYYSGVYNLDLADYMSTFYPDEDASLWNDSQLISYTFGQYDEAKTYFRFFRGYDKDYKKENDPDSYFVKTLKKSGIDLCTEEELEKLLYDRAKEIGWETSVPTELTQEELDAINEDFNVIKKDNIENRIFLKEEFSTEKEIEDIQETVSYVKEHFETEAKSITGSYKVVSGKKEGDKYTVRVEVTDGDNWAELVFPPRDVTFTKDGDTYKFIANKFDWAEESNIDKSYRVDLKEYSGSLYCYTYEYSDEQSQSNLIEPGESFIYVVYNGECVDRIKDHPEMITSEEADGIIKEYLD